MHLNQLKGVVFHEHQVDNRRSVGIAKAKDTVSAMVIALLKGLDKNLTTPVAEDLVLGSGTAIAMALPLFAILMLPSKIWLIFAYQPYSFGFGSSEFKVIGPLSAGHKRPISCIY